MATTNPSSRKPVGGAPPPVLRVTRFDRVSSLLMAIVAGLVLGVLSLFVVWYANRPPAPIEDVPLELVELPGGFEDGSIDETLRLESPEDPTQDPSLAEIPAEENEIQEVLENVLTLSEEATQIVQQQFETDARNQGRAGSATGTGRRALGFGPGESGIPREQRWFVRFDETGSIELYARQLDFFGIELGAILSGGKLIYLSELSADRPTTRTVESGASEKRLYMTWQGGGRRVADLQLFKKAGVEVGSGTIFHFYPPQTEALLAKLERDYAGRPVDQIRRTYFAVKPTRNGYEFVVTQQTYFQ